MNASHLVKDALRRDSKQRASLTRHAEAGAGRDEYKDLATTHIKSFSARLSAVYEANQKQKPYSRLSQTILIDIANDLDPRTASDELVFISAKRKSNGNYRLINQFDIRNQARQILCANAIKPYCLQQLHPAQTIYSGGRPTAAQRIKNLSYVYPQVLLYDIQDFHGSIRTNLSRLLPLSNNAIENSILGTNLNFRLRGWPYAETPFNGNFEPFRNYQPQEWRTEGEYENWSHRADPSQAALQDFRYALSKFPVFLDPLGPINEARMGLPQGAISSSLVAELVLAETLRSVPQITAENAVVYADNLYVFGRRRDCEDAGEALTVALRCCPYGSQGPSLRKIRRTADGFEALGYIFRKRRGQLEIRPLDAKLEKLEQRIQADLRRIVRAHYPWWRLKRIETMRSRLMSTIAAYPLWEAREGYEQRLNAYIHRVLTKNGLLRTPATPLPKSGP